MLRVYPRRESRHVICKQSVLATQDTQAPFYIEFYLCYPSFKFQVLSYQIKMRSPKMMFQRNDLFTLNAREKISSNNRPQVKYLQYYYILGVRIYVMVQQNYLCKFDLYHLPVIFHRILLFLDLGYLIRNDSTNAINSYSILQIG